MSIHLDAFNMIYSYVQVSGGPEVKEVDPFGFGHVEPHGPSGSLLWCFYRGFRIIDTSLILTFGDENRRTILCLWCHLFIYAAVQETLKLCLPKAQFPASPSLGDSDTV